MPHLDKDTIRHALQRARELGMPSIVIKSGDEKFCATLGDVEGASEAEDITEGLALVEQSPQETNVLAPAVGYFRETGTPVEVGGAVEAGVPFAEVVGLGLASDVSSPTAGTIVELVVAPGDAVEYGQLIAKVKP